MEHSTDEKLFEDYRSGDQDAFGQLVSRYEKELYNYLVRFLRKPSLAEEVFQETFLQVHVSAGRFQTDRRFRPWLYTIASNKARDLLRRRARRPTVHLTALDDELGPTELWGNLVRDDTTPQDLALEKERRLAVQQAVERMPEKLKEILILAYFNQLSYREMAEALDIPLGTVKSRLHAAVAAFAKEYANIAGEDGE